jgi:hypothetical protein
MPHSTKIESTEYTLNLMAGNSPADQEEIIFPGDAKNINPAGDKYGTG